MFSSSKVNFCKNEDCPASQELLDFQNGDGSRVRSSEINLHLALCEFCSAEVEFYSHYPQSRDEDLSEPAEIPAPLFELAEAILKDRHSDTTSLDMLFREDEEFLYDNV